MTHPAHWPFDALPAYWREVLEEAAVLSEDCRAFTRETDQLFARHSVRVPDYSGEWARVAAGQPVRGNLRVVA